MSDDDITLSSALFQAWGWLKAKYPEGSEEAEIAEVCFQAQEALEEIKLEQVDRVIKFLEDCDNMDVASGIGQIFGFGSDEDKANFRGGIAAAIWKLADQGKGYLGDG